ncbi:hypothetical protein RHMOL_Rhmol02G0296500 [Rhododendron molle]|uniref:Uncharacterized protein n=1 Tax=Rhododendron molle TaxID=49168 RepID=A0ACC0PW42_RHOML|nr:hypothetical protein RHMOL_Rhmol02G0296500 [Rhododendron molle]
MAEKQEQVKPLAPASHRQYFTDNNDTVLPPDSKKQRHRNYVQCCGCIVALMLIQAVVLLVLIFTVFRIKDPNLKMNSVRISGLDSTNLSSLTALTNITVTADVSIKNPNVVAFKFSNVTTTKVYYGGVEVGEGGNQPGVVAAQRTLRLNVTVELAVGKFLGVPRLVRDLTFGELNVSTYTRVGGKVKILGLFKKNVVVKMNCTMSVNVTSRVIGDQSCWQGVSI